jgi:hypothetical protein
MIGAEEARTLGVISEFVTRDRLLDRAREIAGRIARLPPLTASYTRVALTQKLRRVVDESVGYGLAVVSTTPAYHRKRVVAPFSFSEADCPLISRYVQITRPGTKDGAATLQARTRHREVTDEGDCGDG